MKRILKSAAMLLAVLAVFAAGCHKENDNNGGGTGNGGSNSGNGGGGNPTTGTVNGHAWVDLGLPSGTLWATTNIGADTPEAYGDYFAWGETQPQADNLITLEASDDAATANWGGAWRMPTSEELTELKDNCTVTWTKQNGVNGCLFTGPNGNSIFLPAAGFRSDGSLNFVGSYGLYWSSSIYTDSLDYAWNLYFGSGDYGMYYNTRGYGFTVRPVCSVSQK